MHCNIHPKENRMASKKTSLRSQNGFRNKVDEALQLALKFSPSPMWILDRESLAFLEINKAAQTQLGYGAAKLKGMTIVDIFPEDEKMRLFPNLKRVGRIGLFSGNWHLLPKNGQTLSVTLTSHPLTYKGNKALLITASQLISAESAPPDEGSHEDEKIRYLAFVMNRISSAVISTDPTLRITQWNKAAESLYGWEEAEVIGQLIDEVCQTEFNVEQQALAHSTLLTEKRWHGELKQRHRDGREIWVSASVTLLDDADGRFIGGVTINHDITERKLMEDDLRRTKRDMEEVNLVLQNAFEREQLASRTDALTGVFNRRYFFEFIEYEVALSKRYRNPFSLIMFDVDHLKLVNDTAGHQAGDEVLKQVAHLVHMELRNVDILARYGGDEFVILLPNSGRQDALILAERIREQVVAANLKIEGDIPRVTISIGIADFHGGIESSAELIRHADEALYSAKQSGRNCIAVYSPN